MASIVDKYYRRIIQNIDNVRMKFDISTLLVKSKEHDSKIETNKNNIAENLTLINSKFETNKNNISENLTLINSNENRLDNIENDIVNINTKATNNYNITQINKKNIDFKTGIIDNQITAINSTLNDLKTKNNNSKYSIENFFIYNIEIENTYTLNSDNLQFGIFNYDLEDDFKKDSILEINARLLYDYNSYNNIGKLIHNYKLYDAENVLFHEFKSLKSNAEDNLKDDLSQIDLFYLKLNKDYDRIKIELILSMKEGLRGAVICELYKTFNSNFLCVKYMKKNQNYISVCINYVLLRILKIKITILKLKIKLIS